VRVIDYIFLLKRKCTIEEEGIGEKVGLSTSEMHCIEAIHPKEQVSGMVLAGRMGLSPSRGSRIIESLMEKGLLNKEIDSSDRRYSVIYLR
jgi:DNA-binding MarR family transcriptional regulator